MVRRLLGLGPKRPSTFSLVAFVAAGGASAAMNAARERARAPSPPDAPVHSLSAEAPPQSVVVGALPPAELWIDRDEPLPRRRIRRRAHALAILVVVLLTSVPLAANAARDATYDVEMEAFLAADGTGDPVAYVGRLLSDPVVAANASTTSGLELDTSRIQQETELRQTLRSVLITVHGQTPEQAQAAARGLRLALNGASDKRLAFGPEPAVPEPPRRLDRLVERLPGPFPPRRDPLWVGLAGLAAGLVLCAAWYTYALRPSPA
jgi:hypothetical protein